MKRAFFKCRNATKLVIQNQKFCSQTPQCEEVRIPVPWGHIAGKWWGPKNVRPILTLHGWQDNCGSFDRLIPSLDSNAYLTIDLPGHGHSSWLPSGSFYHFIDYVVLCRYIKQYFGWPKVSFMGHSMGAIISYTYTMFYPKEVDFMIGIDGLNSLVRKVPSSFISSAIDNFLKFSKQADDHKEPPSYSIEELKTKVCEPNRHSISREFSEYILKRNVTLSKEHPGKYYFSRDPRLKVFALMAYNQQELLEWAQNITTPILIMKATDAGYYQQKDHFYELIDILKKVSKDLEMHYVAGSHHVHLNNPENVKDHINKFIRRHDREDRKIGGIKEDILVGDQQISTLL